MNTDILNTLGMTKWSASPNHFYLSILPLITQITQSFFNQSCLVQDNEVWLYLIFVWWWILLGSCDYNHWNWQVITPARAWGWWYSMVKIIKDEEGIWQLTQLDWFVSNRLIWEKKDILKVLWSNTSSLVCRLTHFHLEMRV